MKEEATDSTSFNDFLVDKDHYPDSPGRNLEGANRPKWYAMIPYDQIIPHIPKLRYIRGSKAKISITTFEEVNRACQQIFECNKSFFRFRVQVDLLAHYLGTKILEQIYVVMQGGKKTPLSKILEDSEVQFELWDQMKAIKEIFQSLCDKRVEGFITDEEMDAHVDKYLATFESDFDREKMARVIDVMIEKGEFGKAAERNRKRYERKYKEKKANDMGIGVV
jgi:hypothetical protein